jgi:hypothetical protein
MCACVCVCVCVPTASMWVLCGGVAFTSRESLFVQTRFFGYFLRQNAVPDKLFSQTSTPCNIRPSDPFAKKSGGKTTALVPSGTCESGSAVQRWVGTPGVLKYVYFVWQNDVPERTVFLRHQPPHTSATVTLLPRKVGENDCIGPVWDVRKRFGGPEVGWDTWWVEVRVFCLSKSCPRANCFSDINPLTHRLQ